ncbi:uncharacterized protein LOC120511482 [Passer montanus]|uniref:uncharacterized protein LOC120511482 n=1 Tax=Passer montanus TaxID=9160 RepID=UPI001961CBA7|nr:uncharacterized protein LOC120511482 [Passer montanus]
MATMCCSRCSCQQLPAERITQTPTHVGLGCPLAEKCPGPQMFSNVPWCQEMLTMFTKGAAEPGPTAPQSIAAAPSLDHFGERLVSNPSQVPGFVRNMHQKLVSDGSPDDRLFMDILRLTEAHPTDVAVTLLRCAPSCDRGAAIMWKTIASSGTTVEKVLPTLLCVMDGWPLQKMYTSDGDNKDVFALAGTRVIWEMLRLPWCPEPFVEYSPHLLVALLCQVLITTEQMSEDVLDCLDLNEWGNIILEIMTRHLHSESMERCRLALKGLVVLSRDPSMAKKMCGLSECLVELLKNEDTEVVEMSLSVFTNLLLNKDILTSSPTAPKLADALRPLFDNDNSHVQLLSIRLYQKVMESVVEKGKNPLKMHVSQSLTSRATEHLRLALPYLQSPQEPLREAAVRSIGIAGMLMRGQPEELQLICEALQALSTDDSPSNTNLIVRVMFDERATALNSSESTQPGQHQIPCKRRHPGDQRRATAAPSTADAGQT